MIKQNGSGDTAKMTSALFNAESPNNLRKYLRQEEKERREAITAIIEDVIAQMVLIISILSLLIAQAALKLKLH